MEAFLEIPPDKITISLPLSLFALLAITSFDGYLETDSKALITELLTKDPLSTIVHIEEIKDSKGQTKLWQIWRRADWEQAYERIVKARTQSAQRILDWDKRKRNIKKLMRGIKSLTGLDDISAESLANNILRNKPKSATAFDVVLEE